MSGSDVCAAAAIISSLVVPVPGTTASRRNGRQHPLGLAVLRRIRRTPLQHARLDDRRRIRADAGRPGGRRAIAQLAHHSVLERRGRGARVVVIGDRGRKGDATPFRLRRLRRGDGVGRGPVEGVVVEVVDRRGRGRSRGLLGRRGRRHRLRWREVAVGRGCAAGAARRAGAAWRCAAFAVAGAGAGTDGEAYAEIGPERRALGSDFRYRQ